MDSATQNGESGLNPDCVRIDMLRGERVERCNNNTLTCSTDHDGVRVTMLSRVEVSHNTTVRL